MGRMDGWMDCFVVGESGREVDKTDSGCLTIGQVQEKKKYTTTRRAAAKKEEEEEEEENEKKQLKINCGAGQQRDGRQRLFRYRAFDYSGYRSSSIVVVEKWRERVSTV